MAEQVNHLKQNRWWEKSCNTWDVCKKDREHTGDKTTNTQEYWRHASDFREALQDDIFPY